MYTPHPTPADKSKELVRGVSTNGKNNDVNSTKQMGVPNYAIDDKNIYKVDQNGKISKPLDRNTDVLRDALETSGGKK